MQILTDSGPQGTILGQVEVWKDGKRFLRIMGVGYNHQVGDSEINRPLGEFQIKSWTASTKPAFKAPRGVEPDKVLSIELFPEAKK